MRITLNSSELLYVPGTAAVFIAGLTLGSSAAGGIGLLLLYYFREVISSKTFSYKNSPVILLIWDLLFLAAAVLMLFSVSKIILNVMLQKELPVVNQWILAAAVSCVIYFEIQRRIYGGSKNGQAVLLLTLLVIVTAASVILGNPWQFSDPLLCIPVLGFLIIKSFAKACRELSDLLQE